MPRDIDQLRVYEWQWEELEHVKEPITLEDATKLSKRVGEEWSLAPCPIKLGRSSLRSRSYYRHVPKQIVLAPEWGLNKRTVIHELAHYVEHSVFGKTAHGPVFRFVYVSLLSTHCDCDFDELVKSLNRCGLYVEGQPIDFEIVDGKVQRANRTNLKAAA